MPKPSPRRVAPAAPRVATSFAVAGAFLLACLATLPRVAGPGDASELTAVLATLGLAHPTGYPLYTLVGHAFVVALHGLGASWAWAANAFSALGAAAALGLWHAFAARLLAREGVGARAAALVALLPVAALAGNPVWLGEARYAEVNSWHVAWVAAACLLAWTTAARFDARGDRPGDAWLARRALAWSLLVGLGVAHHATSLLFAAPLSVGLLAAARPRPSVVLAPALAGLAVPPLAWSYVLHRSTHPAKVQWGSLGPGLASTWNHVTAAGYRHYLGGFAPSAAQAAELSAHVYPWLVAGVLATGAWALRARGASRPVAPALGAALVAQLGYVFSYAVGDPAPYFLPALALGLCAAPAALARAGAARRNGRVVAGVAALVVAVTAWRGIAAARADDAGLAQVDQLLRTMWNAVPTRRGYVIWDSDLSARLIDYQRLEGAKPELVVVRPRLLMDDGARALWARAHGFDPLAAGARPPDDAHADDPAAIRAFAAAIGDGINAATRDSVILFEPEKPALELLPKPPR